MNRCVYSHHHARLEIEPALSNCEPVFKVANATRFQPHPVPHPAPSPASSGTPSVSQDLGGPPFSSGAGAPSVSLHSADAPERPVSLAPVPPTSPLTTRDSLHQVDVPQTCCADPQLLQPSPPPCLLSPTAPPFYPPASVPHYRPPVPNLNAPTTMPDRLSTASTPPLPSDLRPPVTVIQPLPPPEPPDPPEPPPDPPDPPDPPPLQDLQTPRSCPSYSLSPADRSDVNSTHLKTVTTALSEHVNMWKLPFFLNSTVQSKPPKVMVQSLPPKTMALSIAQTPRSNQPMNLATKYCHSVENRKLSDRCSGKSRPFPEVGETNCPR